MRTQLPIERRHLNDREQTDFEKRFDAVVAELPRNYVSIVHFMFPGKYKNNQIRDFKNDKTYNFEILADFERIISYIQR